MKAIGNFVKTTLLGGLFVLLPILLFGLMLGEIFDLAIALATPMADALPGEMFRNPKFPLLLAVILILLACFIAGLLVMAPPVRAMGGWIEGRLLLPLPLYRAIKSIAIGFLGSPDADGFKPVWLVNENGVREIAYEIENLPDGNVTILVPWSPTPMAGSVKIVPRKQLQPLAASLGDVTRVLSQWGVGTSDLLKDEAKPPATD